MKAKIKIFIISLKYNEASLDCTFLLFIILFITTISEKYIMIKQIHCKPYFYKYPLMNPKKPNLNEPNNKLLI